MILSQACECVCHVVWRIVCLHACVVARIVVVFGLLGFYVGVRRFFSCVIMFVVLCVLLCVCLVVVSLVSLFVCLFECSWV